MKKKELKNLASKIAKYEKIIQSTQDAKEKRKAEEEIMKLSSSISNVEDMLQIDELVQDILENS
ncbi:MAG: hypothetical protein IKY60_03550 [Bacteroidales bacterium]|nr:hypothetical protein [Bacteroidales bacterium]